MYTYIYIYITNIILIDISTVIIIFIITGDGGRSRLPRGHRRPRAAQEQQLL